MASMQITEGGITYTVNRYSNGDEEWFLNDKRHREQGPAIKQANGYEAWYMYDELHNDNGPAIINTNEEYFYYLGGIKFSDMESYRSAVKIGKLHSSRPKSSFELRNKYRSA
jgi:hypothetical protein